MKCGGDVNPLKLMLFDWLLLAMKKIVIPAHAKGLIFDCDGTIADTMPLHYQSYLDALGPAGKHFSVEMFYEMAGVPAEPVMEELNKRFGVGIDARKVAEEKERLFGERLHHAGSIEAVEQVIHDNHGRLPMAVASGGTRDNITRTLDVLGLTSCFQAMVSADDVERGKPNPDIFLEAARLIGVDPKDCVVFEDADMGIQAAKAAGMEWIDVRGYSEPIKS